MTRSPAWTPRLPTGWTPADLAAYCLMLGDDALVMSQRLTEWVTHLPELETEVAISNVALDLLGQARLLLARAGDAEGQAPGGEVRSEDELAYFRTEREFRNVRLAEVGDDDFAHLVVRLLVFAAWRLALLRRLERSRDAVLAALAAKAAREVRYHQDLAAGWVVRLGDGTDVSRGRTAAALDAVWPWVEELFATHDVERRLAANGVAVDPAGTREDVLAVLDEVLAAARLDRPSAKPRAAVGGRAGRDGVHTEALGPLLAELQSVARQHPNATW